MDSKIIFWGSRNELGVVFLSGVVSGSGSAFSVEIFGACETMPLPSLESRCCAEGLKKGELGGVGVGGEAFAGGFGHGGLAGGVEFGFFQVF